MHDTYPFQFLTINGREVELKKIISRKAIPLTEFEVNTFAFIQQWFSGAETFRQETSGSTGTPKSIEVGRQQMIESAGLTQEALCLQSGETALVCLDTAYIAGKMMLVRSFVSGLKINAINPSANPFKEVPSGKPIDFVALVPNQLHEILHAGEASRFNLIKNVIIGGAALNEEIQKLLSKFRGQFYATYGMTETVSHIALRRLNGETASPYFTVFPGIKIDYDERKCLVIRAPYLPEEIVTNDLVEIVDNTHFKWLGRADNVINTGGVKVIPEKVEGQLHALFQQWNVHNAFLVSSLPDAKLGSKVILILEGELLGVSVDELAMRIRQSLGPYESPKEIHCIVKFAYTKNGKVNRKVTTSLLKI